MCIFSNDFGSPADLEMSSSLQTLSAQIIRSTTGPELHTATSVSMPGRTGQRTSDGYGLASADLRTIDDIPRSLTSGNSRCPPTFVGNTKSTGDISNVSQRSEYRNSCGLRNVCTRKSSYHRSLDARSIALRQLTSFGSRPRADSVILGLS